MTPPTSTPRLSIVVPTYQRRELLKRCTDALRRQDTLAPYEIIIADDGGEDGVRELVAALARRDRRVRYVYGPHAGPAAAKNCGIACARANLIAFVDDDWIVAPDFVRRIVAFFEEHPERLAMTARMVAAEDSPFVERVNHFQYETDMRLLLERRNRLGHHLLNFLAGTHYAFRPQAAPYVAEVSLPDGVTLQRATFRERLAAFALDVVVVLITAIALDLLEFRGGRNFVLLLLLSGCGYNTIQSADEQTKASWSEVLNQYQRRADLVPNLVETVKAFAKQEMDVFTRVTEARARVGSIQATPELVNDPQAFQRFQQAQGELTSALSRLLVVAENYPQLKSDANFRDLQAQLEGTENRIAVARNRYIKAVESYNVTVRSFPTNLTAMVFGHKPKPNFTVEDEKAIATPPKVDFGAKK